MRETFAQAEGRRGLFTATFKRFGQKWGWKYPIKTVLLVNVSDQSGKVTADHIWFTCGKQFKALDLKPGDKIEFVGRITAYEKGYKGNRDDDYFDDRPPIETDYRISFPTKIRKLDAATLVEADQIPLFSLASTVK